MKIKIEDVFKIKGGFVVVIDFIDIN